MASFTRVIGKGKNGKTLSVAGKTRNTVPRNTFIRICRENNGDVRKIAEILDQPANSVKMRYENLLHKGESLPKMQFVQLRKHVEVTPELQRRIATEWNASSGDTKKVANKLGISTATVYSWIKKFDRIYFQKNIDMVAEKLGITKEEAEAKLLEKGTFVSPLCEKKVGQRGKKSAEIVESAIFDIEADLEELAAELVESEDSVEDVAEQLFQ